MSQDYSDSNCQTVASAPRVFPANLCGSISTQGLFYACATLSSPPSLPDQNNDVYNELIYIRSSNSTGCAPDTLFQSLSYKSDACVLSTKRTCNCAGGSCSTVTFAPCNGGSGSVVNNSVTTCQLNPSDTTQNINTQCRIAIAPTPPPTNPVQPPGTDPNTLAKCSDAKTFNECVNYGLVPPQNFPTLPTTGLISKCCVWCGQSQTSGSCAEPQFSPKTCQCPDNSTSFVKQAEILSCGAGTTFLGCACTGRPVGAPTCANAQGGTNSTGAASSLSAAWIALLLALVAYMF